MNQCSRSLLVSPLEGAPAAPPRGCQPTRPPAALPHPSQEASGLRLLHGSPKMCVGWRQGPQKHIILEINISFTSALSIKETLAHTQVSFWEGRRGWRGQPHSHWVLSLLDKLVILSLCSMYSLFSAESSLPFLCQMPQSHRLSEGERALRQP